MPSNIILSGVNSATTALFSTISELTSTVLIQYREAVKEHCTIAHTLFIKLDNAKHALKSFKVHEAKGTFPPAIHALKAPICQISKESLEAEDVQKFVSELSCAMNTIKGIQLQNFLAIKEEEVTHLTGLLQACPGNLVNAIDAQWATIAESMQQDPTNLKTTLGKEYQSIRDLASWYLTRAQQIAKMTCDKELAKRMKKLEIAEAAANKMSDTPTMGETVALAVEAAFAKQQKAKQGQKRKRDDTSSELNPLRNCHTLTLESKTTTKETKSQCSATQERERPKTSRRESKRQKLQKETIRLLEEKDAKFDVNKIHTYPDAIAEVSEAARLGFIALHCDLHKLDTMRQFSPGVHKQPGVTLPWNIEYFLSLNLKYLFHQTTDFSLPLKAFKLLERSVRIKWMMRNKNDKDFNPKFYVKNSSFEPPKAHICIEKGLARGKEELLRQIKPASHHKTHILRDKINPKVAERYMTDAKLLSCITDKNLGIAVVSKDWYTSQIQEHLNDETTYKKVEEVPVDKIYQCVNEVFEVFPECFTSDMANYVTHSETDTIPEFYGIPKIHKNPWKLRPIVPNMKWVTNHAAKVVDHHFQPLLKLFPWVLSSTRQFCQKISELQTTNPQTLRTGDVKSMYTNIPRRELLRRINKLMEKHGDAYPEKLRMALNRLIELINDACFFSYQGQMFWQKRGLAMGVACAPVLAQLYLAYQEEKRIKVAHRNGLTFYGRYIDDIIASYDSTMNHTTLERLTEDPHLEIEWSDECNKVPFLDTEVFIEEEKVLTKVFQKQLNHYQYIPWDSAHPTIVKKAFVKGELVRYHVICSRLTDYYEALKNLMSHLRARGYPPKVLNAWRQLVCPTQCRFQGGHLVVTSPPFGFNKELPWMLPSQYNAAWDFVQVKPIQKAMIEEWSQSKDIHIPSFAGKRMITSFKRTMSLYDQVRRWNKKILLD